MLFIATRRQALFEKRLQAARWFVHWFLCCARCDAFVDRLTDCSVFSSSIFKSWVIVLLPLETQKLVPPPRRVGDFETSFRSGQKKYFSS